MRSEFPDYRELFRSLDIKSAVVDSELVNVTVMWKTWVGGGF